ncbi:DeoR family transcriptional regulator [Paenibacillus baekrokdamisoli]|uniref:DeoR family transcriptional regulator n=1 Tax=Paenibacillus baekrokdamisoli TaxID=1712516 RepID=A0A3G9J3L2_9BACL|nr:YafY family protein [Paenibacillus baekrokdamisoli]MBB3072089.1 putative DNA-binding transcriptional regulator YafY [Paenibacillus baekrokdamisoli]BBH20391.1 DeoR family transcriptional regulator [Paenibacillus baekrokdamisoli]
MKLERLISMIYMLLNNEVLSASALAEKYKVSQRTIYRDIDVICAAGIPVVSYQGVNGGYGIMEAYKMDKSLLGSYDVGSLITILHSMSTVFEDVQALETINKLQTIQTDTHMPSLSMDIGSQRGYNDFLRVIRTAITECCVIRFEYINAKSERTDRTVEPISLMYKYDNWYLYGFCRGRKDYREFKLSRIADLTASKEHFRKHHQAVPPTRHFDRYKREHSTDAVLHFSVDCLARAMDFFYHAAKSFNDDGSLTLTLKMYNSHEVDWLLPVLLSFGDGVEVVEPPELRQQIKAKLEKMINRYPEV